MVVFQGLTWSVHIVEEAGVAGCCAWLGNARSGVVLSVRLKRDRIELLLTREGLCTRYISQHQPLEERLFVLYIDREDFLSP